MATFRATRKSIGEPTTGLTEPTTDPTADPTETDPVRFVYVAKVSEKVSKGSDRFPQISRGFFEEFVLKGFQRIPKVFEKFPKGFVRFPKVIRSIK